MINVLDTGAKNDGLDTLTVNGTDGDDVFLLRQVSWIGEAQNFSLEYAETPAFVALLHGSLDDVFHRLEPGRRADQLRREHQLAADRQRRQRRRHLRGRRQQLDHDARRRRRRRHVPDRPGVREPARRARRRARGRVPDDADDPRLAEQRRQLPDDGPRRHAATTRSSSTARTRRSTSRATPATTCSRSGRRRWSIRPPATSIVDTFASQQFDHDWDRTTHIVPVYTIDAPINVVGGPDCNRLVIVGSEFGQTPDYPFYGWYDGHHHAIEVDDNFAVDQQRRSSAAA